MYSNTEDWLDYTTKNFPTQVFRNITKFDLLSSTISIPENNKAYIDRETLAWLQGAERQNKVPQEYQAKINLVLSKRYSKKKSYRNFIDKQLPFEEFSEILYKSYGYDRRNGTRGYGSGGALYPVNTIIFILNNSAVETLKRGVYYFNPTNNCLYKLNDFSENDKKIHLALYPSKKEPDSKIVIGYAIDMRKAIRKYKYLGYKNALIEIGLMAQSLKKNLTPYLGEYSCQDFNNRLLTTLADLDVKNSPIEMIQWLGYIKDA